MSDAVDFWKQFGQSQGQPEQPQPGEDDTSSEAFNVWKNYSPASQDVGDVSTQKELPAGAKAWLPNGQAYYGEGAGGWWDGVKARWNEKSFRKDEQGNYVEAPTSALQYGARAIKEVVGGVLGAMSETADAAQGVAFGSHAALEDIADRSNSFLPDVVKSEGARNALAMIPGVSTVLAGYNYLRAFTGSRKLVWDQVKDDYEKNIGFYSKMGGTAFLDTNLRAEYLRRFQSGQDDDYLVQSFVAENANPWAEMAYDMVMDPFNLIGTFTSKGAKAAQLAKSQKLFGEIADVAGDLKQLDGLADVAAKAPLLDGIAQKLVTRNSAAAEELLTFDFKKLVGLDARGRMNRAGDHAGQMFGVIASQLKDQPDDMLEYLRATSLIGSRNAEKVREGVDVLTSINPQMAKLSLSERGIETAQFLNRLLDDGDNLDFIGALVKDGNIEHMIGEYSKKAGGILEEMYPSVANISKKQDEIRALEKAGKEIPADLARFRDYKVPDWAAGIAKAHEKIQVDWHVRGLNGKLAEMYITYNPGAAGRNIINNVFTAVMDFSPRVAVDTAIGYSARLADKIDPNEADVVKMLGFKTSAVDRSFGGPGETAAKATTSLLGKLGNKAKSLMEKSEAATSAAIFRNSVKRTLDSVYQEGVAFASADKLRQSGFSEGAVQRLFQLTRKHYGDTTKAIAEWSGEVATGIVQTWRDPAYMLRKLDLEQARSTPKLWSAIEDIIQNGTDEADVLARIEAIRADWQKMASKTDGLIPSYLSNNTPDGEDLARAVSSGMGENEANLFNLKVQAQRNATQELVQAYTNEVRAIMAKHPDPVVRDQIRLIAEQMEKTRQDILDASQHDNMRQAVRNLFAKDKAGNARLTSRQVIEQARQLLPDFGKYVSEIGPEDFRDKIWNYYFTRRNDMHQSSLSKLIGSWDGYLDQVGGIAGKNLSEADGIRIAREQADQYMQLMYADALTKDGVMIDKVRMYQRLGKNKDAIYAMASRDFGIASAGKSGAGTKTVLATINKYLPEGTAEFTKIEDVPFEVAQAALTRRATEKGAKAAVSNLEKTQIPLMGDMLPSPGQAAQANSRGVNALLDRLTANVKTRWGKGAASASANPEQLKALRAWDQETVGRVAQSKAVAADVATKERDFALLNYGEKTALDHAAAYLMPYQYWYSRSYKNWMSRLAKNPGILSKYAQYRQSLEEAHANLPEWWRYNIQITGLPGYDENNPLYFNLEATLNPLNGITGLDFNDQNKIVGQPGTKEYFWTSALNDINKFGPSTWTPITMATAIWLAAKGEKDAAQRWGGRLIPQTAPVKAIAALAGKNLEVDPMVNLLSGKWFTGYDAYEAIKIGRQLYALGDKYSMEQVTEAAQAQSGPIWEEAQLKAAQSRAVPNLASFMFGVGWKARSASDMEIDKFYEEYNNIWSHSENLSPQDLRVALDKVRGKYPFMDAVLLSKKGGVERDRAYAYNVLGRIAPGQTSDIAKAAGITPELLDKFYADKGKIEGWKEDDRLKFMGAVATIGTSLAIPSTATQQEWTQAKNAYKSLNDLLVSQHGPDIWDKVNVYYSLGSDSDKDLYLKAHPEVSAAMEYKNYAVSQSPILSAYYDGLSNIEDYYKGEFKRVVGEKVAKNYFDLLYQRDGLFDKKDLAAFDLKYNIKALNKQYSTLKKQWDALIDRRLLEYGSSLPQGTMSQMQQIEGQPSTGQQAISETLAPAPGVNWQDIESLASPALQDAMEAYFSRNRPLSAAEKSALGRLAKYTGFTSDEIMQAAASNYE